MWNESVHLVGICGSGMSALARILLDQQIAVSGTDQCASPLLAELQGHGVGAKRTRNACVVYSGAVAPNHPELLAARSDGCEVIHRSELLKRLMQGYKPLIVSGTHGKTTVTALLAHVLLAAGLDPAFAIGGLLRQLNTNGRHGRGSFFVAEGDESDGSHLTYEPFGAIITGAEPEHLDYYGSPRAFQHSFQTFFTRVTSPEHLFWCADDPYLQSLETRGISYGFSETAHLRCIDYVADGFAVCFGAQFGGATFQEIYIPLMGRHNALNGLAVFGLALSLGIDEAKIRSALASFPGVVRRCEPKPCHHSVLILDDYAHHPTELRATLQAVKEAVLSRRLLAVVQPHRYCRTRDCLPLYGGCCDDADLVVVTDIASAREEPLPDLDASVVVSQLAHPNCIVVPREDLAGRLLSEIRPHDVVVFLGAGDITAAASYCAAQLQRCPPKRYRVGLLCGGHPTEHAISLTSAKQVGEWLRADCYEVERFVVQSEGSLSLESYAQLAACDLLFPVLHGPKGEDGLFAALAELLDKPFVGCDYRSSAVAMDKAWTKRLAASHGIPTLPFVEVHRGESFSLGELTFPLIVKPVHLGSSVGVSRASDVAELTNAMQRAFLFDSRLIIEPFITGRELEFAVLDGRAAPPGEVLTGGEIYSLERKYGAGAMPTDSAPALPPSILKKGMGFAELAYRAIGCSGWARADFFLVGEQWWLHEINPIPGCTPTSLFPLIWERQGVSFPELMDRLICHALHRKRLERRWERAARSP